MLLHIGELHRGVFHHVMENGGLDGLAVHAQLHQDAGHFERMADIRLPGGTALPLVRLAGGRNGPVYGV